MFWFEPFPSPYGDMFFSIRAAVLSSRVRGFPSPYGDMFFSMNTAEIVQNHFSVSVPLRGYVFLNYCSVLYKEDFKKFPSPYGDMFFSILTGKQTKPFIGKVSVPLRGYVFLNTDNPNKSISADCFRPLTGICFSQLKFKNRHRYPVQEFPSPYGDMFFSIDGRGHSTKRGRFPSPYGDMFFSILCLQTTGRKGLQRRSAALTAAGFFLNLCASLVTLFFQPLPLQNTSFSLNSQIFQTSVENGCTSMVQAPISYSSPRYFAHFTVWGETPRRRS